MIFLYAINDDERDRHARTIGERILQFLGPLRPDRRADRGQPLQRWRRHEHRQLTVIAHGGRCAFSQIATLTELSGIDVIIVRRLPKNSLDASEYVLLTAAAKNDLNVPHSLLREQ